MYVFEKDKDLQRGWGNQTDARIRQNMDIYSGISGILLYLIFFSFMYLCAVIELLPLIRVII